MKITELEAVCTANGLLLSAEQLQKLTQYAELLRTRNQTVNLISRKDEENILSKHILHSLTLLFPLIAFGAIPSGANIFDLGTGGGLPGIPVKIARDDISITLCDSIAKKIAAIKEIIRSIGLKNVTVLCDRAENIATTPSCKNIYDIVITRAVAPLDELLKWSFPLLKKGGILLALKGGNIDEEKQRAMKLKFVKNIEERDLSINNFDEFRKEEKKVVRVTML